MESKHIPTGDKRAVKDNQGSGVTPEIEKHILEAYSKDRENLIREDDMRHTLRKSAAFAAIVFSVIMLIVWLASYYLLYWRGDCLMESSVHVIAVMITPIVSITTILTAMLLAAFRGRKDDADRVIKAATDMQPKLNFDG